MTLRQPPPTATRGLQGGRGRHQVECRKRWRGWPGTLCLPAPCPAKPAQSAPSAQMDAHLKWGWRCICCRPALRHCGLAGLRTSAAARSPPAAWRSAREGGVFGCRKGQACMSCIPVQLSLHIRPRAVIQPLPHAAQDTRSTGQDKCMILHGSAEASSAEADKQAQAEHPPGETAAARSAACRCPSGGSASRWPRYARPGHQPAHARMQSLLCVFSS